MDVTPLIRPGSQVIQAYAGGGFRVSGRSYESAIIVTPESTTAWAPSPELSAPDFGFFLERKGSIDVVLLGTGKVMRILPLVLRRELKELGLSVEAMDTGAACRTYNVLMAEGRRVAAALMPYL